MTEDRFEATFVVRTSPEDTWEILAEGRRADGTWWLPGFDTVAVVESVDEGKQLRTRKVQQPCANTEIVVTVESSATGTSVTVVQSGFGTDFFAAALDSLEIGWSHILADVILYFERGVDGGRHSRPWAMLGASVAETPVGLEVDAIWGGLAQAVGMRPGDILLTLGGAPLFTRRELETALRILPAGEAVEVTWAHGRELRRATAPL